MQVLFRMEEGIFRSGIYRSEFYSVGPERIVEIFEARRKLKSCTFHDIGKYLTQMLGCCLRFSSTFFSICVSHYPLTAWFCLSDYTMALMVVKFSAQTEFPSAIPFIHQQCRTTTPISA